MRRLPVKELAVALHILAKLAGCKPDLLEIVILLFLVKAEEALVPLEEGDGAGAMDLELQGNQDLFLKVNYILLRDVFLFSGGQKGKHSVERR